MTSSTQVLVVDAMQPQQDRQYTCSSGRFRVLGHTINSECSLLDSEVGLPVVRDDSLKQGLASSIYVWQGQ